jgi:hypothetical protein
MPSWHVVRRTLFRLRYVTWKSSRVCWAGHEAVKGGVKCILVGKAEEKVTVSGDLNLDRRMQLK